MLLSRYTHPARSTGPESNRALSQGCPIEDERSDCGKGHAAPISPKTRPPRSRARSGCRSHPRLNRSCPNTMKNGGEVVIDSHANGSEKKRDASCRKRDNDRIARPGKRVKGGIWKGTGGRTPIYEERLDASMSEVKTLSAPSKRNRATVDRPTREGGWRDPRGRVLRLHGLRAATDRRYFTRMHSEMSVCDQVMV